MPVAAGTGAAVFPVGVGFAVTIPPVAAGTGVAVFAVGVGFAVTVLPVGAGTGVAVFPVGVGFAVTIPPVGAGTGVAVFPVGVGFAVTIPPVGTGTSAALHADAVGTGTADANVAGARVANEVPAGLATGAAARFPVPVAAGEPDDVALPVAGIPVAGVPVAGEVPLGVSVAGVLAAVLAAPDAGLPELDAAAAEQPARARLVATPRVQPAAALAVLLCDRTRMLLEVVPGSDPNTRKYGGTCGKFCPAGSNLLPCPSV